MINIINTEKYYDVKIFITGTRNGFFLKSKIYVLNTGDTILKPPNNFF